MTALRRVNLFTVAAEEATERPDGYRFASRRLAPAIGVEQAGRDGLRAPARPEQLPLPLRVRLRGVAPRVSGRPTLRHPGGEDELEPGDLVGFPEGPAGAHKVTNPTDETVRIMILSTKGGSGVAVYPDSDKVGLFTEDGADDVMVRRESDVDYWDREV